MQLRGADGERFARGRTLPPCWETRLTTCSTARKLCTRPAAACTGVSRRRGRLLGSSGRPGPPRTKVTLTSGESERHDSLDVRRRTNLLPVSTDDGTVPGRVRETQRWHSRHPRRRTDTACRGEVLWSYAPRPPGSVGGQSREPARPFVTRLPAD